MTESEIAKALFVGVVFVGSLIVFDSCGEPERLPAPPPPQPNAASTPAPAAAPIAAKEPCSPYWDAPNPCPLTPEEEQALIDGIAADEAAARPASVHELKARASELIQVESARIADGYWQALVTITNKTGHLIEARNSVDCILFGRDGERLALTTQVRPDVDLSPGESFTDDAMAEVQDEARVERVECRFRT